MGPLVLTPLSLDDLLFGQQELLQLPAEYWDYRDEEFPVLWDEATLLAAWTRVVKIFGPLADDTFYKDHKARPEGMADDKDNWRLQ